MTNPSLQATVTHGGKLRSPFHADTSAAILQFHIGKQSIKTWINTVKTNFIAALLAFPVSALNTQSAGAAPDPMRPPQICGTDPRILTDINIISYRSGKAQVGSKVDIRFDVRIAKPCDRNLCTITVKDGTSGKIFATIPIVSDHIAFCRNKDPLLKLSRVPSNEPKVGCSSTLYTTLRRIIFVNEDRDIHDISATGFLIEREQNKYRIGTTAFTCLIRSAGEDDIGIEKLKILETSQGSRLSILRVD